MERIKLDFIPGGSPRARLSIIEPESRFWGSLVSIFTDETEDIEYHASTEISIPWWVLLLKRNHMGSLLQHYRITPDRFEITDLAKSQISIAFANLQQYQKAIQSKPISDSELDDILSDSGFTRKLFEYQSINVKSLVSLPSGATFSVPGAGKTTEALAFFAAKSNPNTKLLIVCPKNAFAVWEEEFMNCFSNSEKSIVRLRGAAATRERESVFIFQTRRPAPVATEVVDDGRGGKVSVKNNLTSKTKNALRSYFDKI